jgi:hypothetical protein
VRVLVIIPAYNEQDALGDVLDEVASLDLPGIETIVVDDGSTDATADVAHARGARVLQLSRNLGIGGAVQAGLRVAHRERFDCAVQLDGDGQHPPRELPALLDGLHLASRPDLVIGTRYARNGTAPESDHERFQSTRMRRLGSWWLRSLLRGLAGIRVSDPTSGFRVYGTRALALFSATYPYDFPEPESLAVARAAGLRVAEVPVAMRPRQGGSSSISGLSAPYYMLKVTIAIVLTYLRTRLRPRKELEHDA